MKPSRIIRSCIAVAAFVLLSAACTSTSSSNSASPSDSPTIESVGSLPTEPSTGTESPKSPTGGPPSLDVAHLPTGNRDNTDGCIHIAWLHGSIPHGDTVEISVAVQRPFTFDYAATALCKGGPSCAGYRFNANNDTSDTYCNVGLGYIGTRVDNDNGTQTNGSMVITGRLSCPQLSVNQCRSDVVVIQGSGTSSVGFEVGVDLPNPSDTSTPPENPPTSPATSGSSPAAAGSP
jgi:hypothetical protein